MEKSETQPNPFQESLNNLRSGVNVVPLPEVIGATLDEQGKQKTIPYKDRWISGEKLVSTPTVDEAQKGLEELLSQIESHGGSLIGVIPQTTFVEGKEIVTNFAIIKKP